MAGQAPARKTVLLPDSSDLYAPGPHLYIEQRHVGPKFALAALEQRNTMNRNVSDFVVRTYASAMRNGDWVLTPQGLAFDQNGILIDGQHRLFTVIEAGVAVPMCIAWNVTPDARKVVDTGKPRAVGDQIKMLLPGVTNGRMLAATYVVVRDLDAGEFFDMRSMTGRFTFSDAEALHATLEPHYQTIHATIGSKGLQMLTAKPVGACLWALRHGHVPAAKVLDFLRKTATGEYIGPGDPAFFLRGMLLDDRRRRHSGTDEVRVICTTLVTLRAHLQDERVKLVRPNDYERGTKAREALFSFFTNTQSGAHR